MADEGDILTDLNTNPATGGNDLNGANGEDTRPAAGIVSQYVKDLSVENPNAPACYQWNEQPQIDLQFNIAAHSVNDEITEIELKVNVTAKTGQGDLYLIELKYCGLVGMRNLPDDQAHAFMFAEAPRILFPFVRRVIADASRDAGFPPLMMDPMDFGALYQQQLAARAQQQAGGDSQPVPGSDTGTEN